jgi:Sec-independent protein translocase protein TatA
MFDIGLGELVFIFIVFLVLFGPKSLPDLARKSATVLNKVKKAQAEFQSQFNAIQNDITSTIEIDKLEAGIKIDDLDSEKPDFRDSKNRNRKVEVKNTEKSKENSVNSSDKAIDHTNKNTTPTDNPPSTKKEISLPDNDIKNTE